MRIFFAGPLTNLSNPQKTKAFYESLGQTAKSCGFDSFWAYQHGTDPELNPDVPAQKVYKTDTQELAKSDLVIAYVGEDSTGTGIEIEFARENNIPVVLLSEKGKAVSRMIRGNPAVKKEIIFENEDDALFQLKTLLNSHFQSNEVTK